MEPVTRDQLVSARCTGEALEVVDIALCPHDHFTGGNGLTTCTASPRVPKQPDVVCSAEDHASFAVAGGPDLSQLSLTARALEAARVPVALHGEEQETVSDVTPTACARPGRARAACNLTVHHSYSSKSLDTPVSCYTV